MRRGSSDTLDQREGLQHGVVQVGCERRSFFRADAFPSVEARLSLRASSPTGRSAHDDHERRGCRGGGGARPQPRATTHDRRRARCPRAISTAPATSRTGPVELRDSSLAIRGSARASRGSTTRSIRTPRGPPARRHRRPARARRCEAAAATPASTRTNAIVRRPLADAQMPVVAGLDRWRPRRRQVADHTDTGRERQQDEAEAHDEWIDLDPFADASRHAEQHTVAFAPAKTSRHHRSRHGHLAMFARTPPGPPSGTSLSAGQQLSGFVPGMTPMPSVRRLSTRLPCMQPTARPDERDPMDTPAHHRWMAGVASGISDHASVPAWVVRLALRRRARRSPGVGPIAYALPLVAHATCRPRRERRAAHRSSLPAGADVARRRARRDRGAALRRPGRMAQPIGRASRSG